MGKYSREELEKQFKRHTAAIDEMCETGDWSGFVDLFTDDVHFVEYNAGVFNGREELSQFVQDGFHQMRYPAEWVAYDEENGAVVVGFRNIWDHPTEPGVGFEFPNVSRFVYVGNDKFAVEEDVYNPAHLDEAMQAWLATGVVPKPTVGERLAGQPVLAARRVERIAPVTAPQT